MPRLHHHAQLALLGLLCLLLGAAPVRADRAFTDRYMQNAARQGVSFNDALAIGMRDHPGMEQDLMASAQMLISALPYGLCDGCLCDSAGREKKYQVDDLQEVDRSKWVGEVVDRYLSDQDELKVSATGGAEASPYFYHFKASLDQLQPYLKEGEGTPSFEDVKRWEDILKAGNLEEPIRLMVSVHQGGGQIPHGRALLQAAQNLGITELPVRFSFVDCAVCGANAGESHYKVDELRSKADFDWAADRFFNQMEFVWVDKAYPGKYPFDYHMDGDIDYMLNLFSGDPDPELKKKWLGQLDKGLQEPLDVAYLHWQKKVSFEDEDEKEIHALLAAAKEKGIQQLPVRLSFQDQLICQAGQRRIMFSAQELFPEGRIPLVMEKFSNGRKRLIYDEVGRQEAFRKGYPFGENFPYHMMVQVAELYPYIPQDQLPKQEDIDAKAKEMKEKGVLEPVYLKIKAKEKSIEFFGDAALIVAAAKQLNFDHLPVTLLYIEMTDQRREAQCWSLFTQPPPPPRCNCPEGKYPQCECGGGGTLGGGTSPS
jgi:hypothetical protein